MSQRATRILQLGKFYPIRGGVEKVMYDLTEGLQCDMLCAASKGQRPGTIQPAPQEATQQAHQQSPARIIVLPALCKLKATMICPKMITWLRNHKKDYDIIHVHHPDPMAALALRLSGYRGKVVLHWHSDILKQKTLLKFYKPLQTWLIQRADKIVGTTPVYVQESEALKDVQYKVTYLPIGVDTIQPNPQKVQEIKTRYQKNIIFTLGRLIEYKGFEYLIKAMQYIPGDYHLIIGGQGPLEQPLKELAKGLDVTFLGWIPEEDRESYFAACDVFVLPSIHKTEAFGIVQIEAMSQGKPVVATQIEGSGVAWVNADGVTGRNVPPKDPQALAAAIEEVIANKEAYGRAARARYEALFTKQAMIDGCLHIYNSIDESRLQGACLAQGIAPMIFPEFEKSNSARMEQVRAVVSAQEKVWRREGLSYALFKGESLSAVYPRAGQRCSGDIDWYFPPESWDKALEIARRNTSVLQRDSDGDVHYCIGGVTVEHHRDWTCLSSRKLRRIVGAAHIIDGRLSPEDTLLMLHFHIFHHLAYQGACLRQFTDLMMALDSYRGAYDAAAFRAKVDETGMQRWCALVAATLVELGAPRELLPVAPLPAPQRAQNLLRLVLSDGCAPASPGARHLLLRASTLLRCCPREALARYWYLVLGVVRNSSPIRER